MSPSGRNRNQETESLFEDALNNALNSALRLYENPDTASDGLTVRLITALDTMSRFSQKASTGFTNIMTCLTIKAAMPNVDIRYHQVQIQDQTDRPAGFNFRGVSEKFVYPWLNKHDFEGAKSGWQTRTFERPKPYMMDYDENIGDIKDAFLTIFDEIEVAAQPAKLALAYILFRQIEQRESKKVTLYIPKTNDIHLIVSLFSDHFFFEYRSSKGASRLPVLALYSVYSILVTQLKRYQGMTLKPLAAHSAADSQTGSVGDIEVFHGEPQEVFEAVEVKHNIPVTERLIIDAVSKIMNRSVTRYYILTTHSNCEPDASLQARINTIEELHSCQIIVNGVIPSLKYYLRLLSQPSLVFPAYTELLSTDSAIGHEHRAVWNHLSVENRHGMNSR